MDSFFVFVESSMFFFSLGCVFFICFSEDRESWTRLAKAGLERDGKG